MTRRKQTVAEYVENQALLVPLILGDMIEHLGAATIAWSEAVDAVRRGDLDKALDHVVAVEIAADVPIRVGRSEIRSITRRAGELLDAELPDEDESLDG
jgi:hypothetical protein